MSIVVPDLVSNSYFPALAAEDLGYYAAEGLEAHVEVFSLPPAPWSPSATALAWYRAGMHQDEAREPLHALQRSAYVLRFTPVLAHEAPRRGRPWCSQ
jgi:hypothetical protein